jgi:hypothetical protein
MMRGSRGYLLSFRPRYLEALDRGIVENPTQGELNQPCRHRAPDPDVGARRQVDQYVGEAGHLGCDQRRPRVG